MTDQDRFRFVSLLALELENGDISLPSLPDVVMKIRGLLEKEDCDFAKMSNAISVDAVLVSRLLLFANSAFYDRANVKIETVDAAIGRLGFEAVRSAAVSIALKQLYAAEKHRSLQKYLRAVWARGMKMSSMCFAVAKASRQINEEQAFLTGLLHDVGKLYILTKVPEFPEFMGDARGLESVLDEWSGPIGKSIIESWGFPDDVAESADPHNHVEKHTHESPTLVDVVLAARTLLDGSEEEDGQGMCEAPWFVRLAMDEKSVADALEIYRDKLQSVQKSLA